MLVKDLIEQNMFTPTDILKDRISNYQNTARELEKFTKLENCDPQWHSDVAEALYWLFGLSHYKFVSSICLLNDLGTGGPGDGRQSYSREDIVITPYVSDQIWHLRILKDTVRSTTRESFNPGNYKIIHEYSWNEHLTLASILLVEADLMYYGELQTDWNMFPFKEPPQPRKMIYHIRDGFQPIEKYKV